MTTKAAEELHLAQHRYEHEGKRYATYNPNEYSALQAHLNTIRDYVLAAQQTPITPGHPTNR
jgi:hypothetical protein